METIGTVICCDVGFIAYLFHFLFQNDQVFAAGTVYSNDIITGFFERFGCGIGDSRSHTSADAYGCAEFLNMRRLAQWAYHIHYRIPCFF